WVDHDLIDLKTDNITAVDMGTFKIQKSDGKWVLSSQGKESRKGSLHDSVAQSLLDAIGHLSINTLLGDKADPSYDMEHPALTVKVSLSKGE
ncbi:hypothetical protein ABTE40_20285, partial [Acinetobacter baumannii]